MADDIFSYHDLNDDRTNEAPYYTNLTKSNDAPRVAGGVLWADQTNEKLFLFGGEHLKGRPGKGADIWQYDPWENKWSSVEDTVNGDNLHRPAFGASTVVEHQV